VGYIGDADGDCANANRRSKPLGMERKEDADGGCVNIESGAKLFDMVCKELSTGGERMVDGI